MKPEQMRVLLAAAAEIGESKRLINWAARILASTEIDESQRDELIEVINARLRQISPRAANKIFGGKDKKARSLLEREIADLTDVNFDSSVVRPGVKTGGLMLEGVLHVNVYASYKSRAGEGVSLEVDQREADRPLYVILRHYRTGRDSTVLLEIEKPVSELSDLGSAYRRLVREISTRG